MSEAFPNISKIKYEGADSRNSFAFKYYNADELVEGKPMKDHLHFAASYWHTMRGNGQEIFGFPTMLRPWEDWSTSMKMALKRIEVFFEFLEKVGIDYYCFHDRDV